MEMFVASEAKNRTWCLPLLKGSAITYQGGTVPTHQGSRDSG
jgi:hypothetical protein